MIESDIANAADLFGGVKVTGGNTSDAHCHLVSSFFRTIKPTCSEKLTACIGFLE